MEVFPMDEAGPTPSPPASTAATTEAAAARDDDDAGAGAASGSTPGTATPPLDAHCHLPHHPHPQQQQQGEAEAEEIAMERRVVPLLEYSEDTCSICLEDYTKEDPGAPTTCGHHFHLQCIMQWAQRSRECPLCFRGLQLEDEDMNSLLPFGEYVSPAQRAAEQASLETWELERLLIRLATGQREHRHRSSRHRSSRDEGQGNGSSGGGGGGGSRHRRQGSRGEASAPQPIRVSGGGGSAHRTTSGDAATAAAWWSSLPGEGGANGAGSSAGASAGGSATRAGSAPGPGPSYPASWPPSVGPEGSSSSMGAVADEGHVVSPRSRSGSMSLKGRLASLRLKDKFDKTARELKSLFSPGSSSGGPGSSGPASSGPAHH